MSQITSSQRIAEARVEESEVAEKSQTVKVMTDSQNEAPEDNRENIVALNALHTAEKPNFEIKLKGALQEAIEPKSEAG